MFSFQPEEKKAVSVPFYEDAKEKDGWKGQATTKSVSKLQDEISQAINRLGGIVSGFQRGTFFIDDQQREGYQIHYHLKAPNGRLVPGRLDVAALPVRARRDPMKKEKSLRMALYMVREGLEGMWLMQQLSPGFAALMPFMLGDDNKTISQMWSESPIMDRLLPPSQTEFVEGEVKDA